MLNNIQSLLNPFLFLTKAKTAIPIAITAIAERAIWVWVGALVDEFVEEEGGLEKIVEDGL